MKKLLLTLIVAVNSITAAWAQIPDSKQPLPPEIAAIKKANVLVVAMTRNDVPPFFSGQDDNIHGLDVDIARRIGALLGVPVQFRRDAASFAEVVEQVRDGRADIAVSKLSVTGPRLQAVRFSTPYVKLRQGMIVNRLWLSQNTRGREIYQVIREFDGRLGFVKGSSYDTFARVNFPSAMYVPETDWTVIVNKVTEGTISAAYRDEFELKKISIEKPEAAITTKTITISDSVDNIAVAVNYRSLHLLSIVDYVIRNEYNNIDVKKLVERYKSEKLNKDNK